MLFRSRGYHGQAGAQKILNDFSLNLEDLTASSYQRCISKASARKWISDLKDSDDREEKKKTKKTNKTNRPP